MENGVSIFILLIENNLDYNEISIYIEFYLFIFFGAEYLNDRTVNDCNYLYHLKR
mgnify:CR=1 FL=1